MIVITGATGNTGSAATEALLAKGEIVRVIGRDATKLERFTGNGAEAFVGNAESEADMTRAFADATAVYFVIPQALHRNDFRAYQERITDAYAASVAKSGVKYAVVLSSIGAQHADGVGPIVGLHNLEEKLNRVAALNVLHLRPASFMENLLMSINGIRAMNVLPGAFPSDTPIPLIATKDIGAYAAERLAQRDFSAHVVQELLGPREYTMRETASLIGKAIGKPNLAYVQMPMMLIEAALEQMGLPKSSAALLVEMWKGANEGKLHPLESRNKRNTTTTTLESFASDVFAPNFQARAAQA